MVLLFAAASKSKIHYPERRTEGHSDATCAVVGYILHHLLSKGGSIEY